MIAIYRVLYSLPLAEQQPVCRSEQQSVGPRVALIFKSIIILLIIFLGFIKSKPC